MLVPWFCLRPEAPDQPRRPLHRAHRHGVGARRVSCSRRFRSTPTLCYPIVLPGRKWAFRAGFWPDCYRESTEMGPPAGRLRYLPASSPAKIRPGRAIYCPEALLTSSSLSEASPGLRAHSAKQPHRPSHQEPAESSPCGDFQQLPGFVPQSAISGPACAQILR